MSIYIRVDSSPLDWASKDDDQRERDQELIGKPLEEQLRREPAQTAEENADQTPSVILAVVMLMPSFY